MKLQALGWMQQMIAGSIGIVQSQVHEFCQESVDPLKSKKEKLTRNQVPTVAKRS
jgi:hypothetical protein